MKWSEILDATNEEIIAANRLDDLKAYLKIDSDADDTVLILCARAAVQYVIDAVGEFPDNIQSAELLLYAIIQDFYENRELMQMDIQQRKRQQYMYQSMILQLQTALMDDTED